jgi:Leucine-rich repeat (LRR) protein
VGILGLNQQQTRGQIVCSGVLVAADSVLTSTQCLETIADAGLKVAVYLDHPKLQGARAALTKSIENFSSGGTRDYPSLNMSLIRLSGTLDPATTGYTPVEVLRSPDKLQAGAKLLIAGYGRKSSQCNPGTRCSGNLLEAPTSVQSFVDANHLFSTILVGAAQNNEGSVCFGDAGGPAFIEQNGRFLLAGIASGSVSRGLSDLLTSRPEGMPCENGVAAFTFAGDYVKWMSSLSGLTLTAPAADNVARSTIPVIDNPTAISKPADRGDWTGWLAFTDFNDPAFATVSHIQQRLLSAEAASSDPIKLSDLDFFLNPKDAAKRVRNLSELTLKPLSSRPNASRLDNLEPLAAFNSLSKLEIEGAAIKDFSPLATLNRLTRLKLSGNSVNGKLDGLGSLVRLQSLEIDQVGAETLQDIDPALLVNLKSLTIIGNGQAVTLPKAPALETLVISNVDLSNPAQLAGLPTTLSQLKITGSKINSAAFLPTLVNLKALDLTGNLITDFSPVNQLKNLSSVLASGNPATNKFCGVPAAPICEYNQIVNPVTVEEYCLNFVFQPAGQVYAAAFQALAQAQAMTIPKTASECADLSSKLRLMRELKLSGTGAAGVVDLSPIAALQNLEDLSIRNLGVVDVKPLAKLNKLEKLDLTQNLIVDPKALENLPALLALNLTQNAISDLKGFSHPNLRSLTLDSNQLSSAASLGTLPELSVLSFAAMPGFRDIKGLGRLGKLKQLNLGKTDVQDLQALELAVGLEIDAPEAAMKNGCPVLLGTCVSNEGTSPLARSGPIPGLQPGQQLPVNSSAQIDLPGLAASMRVE